MLSKYAQHNSSRGIHSQVDAAEFLRVAEAKGKLPEILAELEKLWQNNLRRVYHNSAMTANTVNKIQNILGIISL